MTWDGRLPAVPTLEEPYQDDEQYGYGYGDCDDAYVDARDEYRDPPYPAGPLAGQLSADQFPTDQLSAGQLAADLGEVVAGDEGGYRGRRRLVPGLRASRHLAFAAVAVGLLLVGTGVVVRLLGTEPVRLTAPPTPAPPITIGPDQDQGRLESGPSASPGPPAGPATAPPAEPPADQPPAAFEAEQAELGSHGQVVTLDGASGGQAVRLSGRADGRFVRFPGVTVAAAGRYQLTIVYFAEQDRTGAVTVNDAAPVAVSFPASDQPGSAAAVTLPVELGAGANTIQIAGSGGPPLTLDRIAITP